LSISYFILPKETYLSSLGIHFGLVSNLYGIFLAFFLISILFLGPLIQISIDSSFIDSNFNISLKPLHLFLSDLNVGVSNLIFKTWTNTDFQNVRTLIVGPITEELVFRSCICSVLLLDFNQNWTILISSFIFGIAHTHHVVEHVIHGEKTLIQAVLIVLFQCNFFSSLNFLFSSLHFHLCFLLFFCFRQNWMFVFRHRHARLL
jgi:membrane protease YdiL (CAAX protease family)